MTNVRELVGTEVQGWRLKEVLGNGADGIVYIGEKEGEEAAVKILFPEVVEKYGFEEALQRIELQLILKGEKHHPNLVQVTEGGKASELPDTLYLVMERVSGISLDKAIATAPRHAIPSLIQQLANAAKFLEDRELVHRDIKPANIVVSDDFSHLTLLDLGIILQTCTDDYEGLSGEEFVATTRYSPPEFVWRTEDRSTDGAWRAITFYQIGATLHDLIMRKPLFDGCDKPRARLYDAVKYQSPEIDDSEVDQWLIQLTKCCLVKNWRERLTLVSWESFSGPSEGDVDYNYQKKMIKLRQIRCDEIRQAQEQGKIMSPQTSRAYELWDLQNQVFLETRQFLMGAQIFPRFSGTHPRMSEHEYTLIFKFETDPQLMFNSELTVEISLTVSTQFESATELKMKAYQGDGKDLFDSKWTEMLTIESASTIVQRSLMEVADVIVPQI